MVRSTNASRHVTLMDLVAVTLLILAVDTGWWVFFLLGVGLFGASLFLNHIERKAGIQQAATGAAVDSRASWMCRYFASGPEGSFFTHDEADARNLIDVAGFDCDEWTVTDLNPSMPPSAKPHPMEWEASHD